MLRDLEWKLIIKNFRVISLFHFNEIKTVLWFLDERSRKSYSSAFIAGNQHFEKKIDQRLLVWPFNNILDTFWIDPIDNKNKNEI